MQGKYRAGSALALVLALGACVAGGPPDRAAGVGFGDYDAYLAEREASLRGDGPIPPAVAPPQAADSAAPLNSAPLGAAPLNPMGAALSAPPTASGVTVQPLAAAATTTGGTTATITAADPAAAPGVPGVVGISDEQNFEAVAARETIQSDAARIAANRAAYVEVAPTPLPERQGDSGPNLAAFALGASNRLGESIYNRSGLTFANHDRACAKYGSADLAQTAFLKNGGPERDLGNLDPDGDGFACTWDPTPFQAARQ